MEVFDATKLNSRAYVSALNQAGNGPVSMDRYVYDQSGEGFGAALGNILKLAVPLAGPIISGIKSLVQKKPNTSLKSVAKDVVTSKEFNTFANDAISYLKPTPKNAIKAGVKRGHKHISGNNHKHVVGGVAKKRASYRKRLRR